MLGRLAVLGRAASHSGTQEMEALPPFQPARGADSTQAQTWEVFMGQAGQRCSSLGGAFLTSTQAYIPSRAQSAFSPLHVSSKDKQPGPLQ